MQCISKFHVSRDVSVYIYTDADRCLTSREYRKIIRMIEFDVATMEECEAEEAAQASEAGTGETERLDPKDESAVAKPCAQGDAS